LQKQGIEVPKRPKGRPKGSRKKGLQECKDRYTDSIDNLLQTKATYADIAAQLRIPVHWVHQRVQTLTDKYIDFPKRHRGAPKGRRKNSRIDKRNAEIVACALAMYDSFQVIGEAYGLSRETVRGVLNRHFSDYVQYRLEKLAESKQKQEAQLRLLQLLRNYVTQKTFLELKEQRGEDYALAWRLQYVYNMGKNYSLETVEKLIHYRRQGEGYHRCVLLSGIASKTSHNQISIYSKGNMLEFIKKRNKKLIFVFFKCKIAYQNYDYA
jgi:DNA-binding Lrp family transcriptional regulator